MAGSLSWTYSPVLMSLFALPPQGTSFSFCLAFKSASPFRPSLPRMFFFSTSTTSNWAVPELTFRDSRLFQACCDIRRPIGSFQTDPSFFPLLTIKGVDEANSLFPFPWLVHTKTLPRYSQYFCLSLRDDAGVSLLIVLPLYCPGGSVKCDKSGFLVLESSIDL